jgi:hypothetical protein
VALGLPAIKKLVVALGVDPEPVALSYFPPSTILIDVTAVLENALALVYVRVLGLKVTGTVYVTCVVVQVATVQTPLNPVLTPLCKMPSTVICDPTA